MLGDSRHREFYVKKPQRVKSKETARRRKHQSKQTEDADSGPTFYLHEIQLPASVSVTGGWALRCSISPRVAVARRNDAMIDQDGIIRSEVSVGLPIHGQLVAANQHVGIAARRKAVRRLARGGAVNPFRRGDAGSITVRHDNSVSAHCGFDPAQQQVVRAAAGPEQNGGRTEACEAKYSDPLHWLSLSSRGHISRRPKATTFTMVRYFVR
jgi:hypothetical protein